MFKNYLKLAIRVLGRKKFFTFISLFGISFTLAILMLIVSFLETELGNNKPFTDRDLMVVLDQIRIEDVNPDTTMIIDSVELSGIMKYDTSYTYGENTSSVSISSISNRLLQDYYTELDAAENYTFFSPDVSFNAYVNNSKIILNVIYTDERYWEVLDFEFLEGQGYDENMFESAEPVVVITDKLAMEYFGETKGIIEREIKMDGRIHKVVGLIKTPSSSLLSAGVFAPATLTVDYPGPINEYLGGYEALFVAKSKKDIERLKEEIEYTGTLIPMENIDNYNNLIIFGKTMMEDYADSIIYREDPKKAKRIFLAILIGFVSLFILLPTLNLINLNVSRIMERSAEIGVRKAFGANKGNILSQFVFENVVLTILGGIIGFVLAILLINLINNAGVLENLNLQINFSFFIYSVLTVLFFGVLSGLLPALRMSRMHIVDALKENKL